MQQISDEKFARYLKSGIRPKIRRVSTGELKLKFEYGPFGLIKKRYTVDPELLKKHGMFSDLTDEYLID